jgi:hypothetical protein
MSFATGPALEITRQVGHALEDEAAQPLAELQRDAPPGCEWFSELEASISEWSFGYGVAWAMARMRDPLLGSAETGRVAEQAVREAWRAFSGQGWTALLAADREQRGPVQGQEHAAAETPDAAFSPTALVPPPAEASAEPPEESQYGDFLGKVARARPRRPPPREG